MAYPQKIVTCCYCGSRAALVLAGAERHELSCASCGAPLRNLKMLPAARTEPPEPHRAARAPKPRAPARMPKRRPKRRRRPGFLKDLVEEAFDIIEDIFD